MISVDEEVPVLECREEEEEAIVGHKEEVDSADGFVIERQCDEALFTETRKRAEAHGSSRARVSEARIVKVARVVEKKEGRGARVTGF
tara:strand:+ start:771 stop:1034 length:264 start_codon:yes stop_codon:yes gene_type:complete